MKILKKGGSREKGGGGEGNEIHAPCACGSALRLITDYHVYLRWTQEEVK